MDGQIQPVISGTINILNQQLIAGFATMDPVKVLPLFSKNLMQKGVANLQTAMAQTGKRFGSGRFKIQHQFYVQNATEGATATVSTGTGNHDYSISFQSTNTDMFVTVGYFEGKIENVALITIYGKYDNEWKLNILQIGTITIQGRDAYNWYEQAQAALGKGYLTDAANDMVLCGLVSKPANNFWHYTRDKDFAAFDNQLVIALNKQYKFPATINLPSKPQVFRIFPQGMNEGYFPMVAYKTSLDIKDTAALSKECDQLNQQIGETFKGLNDGKKYMFYRAYQRLPKPNERVPSYGFVRRGKL